MILACVAWVVAVSGASVVIVDTVAAFHVILQAIALVTSKSVNHHLVILVPVIPISHVSNRLLQSYVRLAAPSIVPSHVHTHTWLFAGVPTLVTSPAHAADRSGAVAQAFILNTLVAAHLANLVSTLDAL